MPNRKTNPREIKLKEKVEELDRLLTDAREEINYNESLRRRMVDQIVGLQGTIISLRERLSAAEDFVKFARFALPHLEERREMMAVNTAANREDTQEH